MDGASQAFGGGLNYFSELLEIQMRNMEAMRLAQQKMLAGVGVLVQHQTEMLEGMLRRSLAPQPSSLASGSDIRAAIVGQVDLLKTSIQEGQANSNILAELAARSSGDVANTLQSRLMAALDEFKAALEHAMPETPKLAGAGAPLAVVPAASQS
jgi:hypothetical protein